MANKDYEKWLKVIASKIGEEVEVVGKDNGENCDFVICRLVTKPLAFPDNLVGHCHKCFRLIQFRPHAPKLPPKLCDECGAKQLAASKEKARFTITENTARDLANFHRRQKMQ